MLGLALAAFVLLVACQVLLVFMVADRLTEKAATRRESRNEVRQTSGRYAQLA